MTDTLSQISVVLIYIAMGLYVVAFMAFAVDLGGRGARASAAMEVTTAAARREELANAQTQRGASSVATLTQTSTKVAEEVKHGRDKSRSMRIGMALTIVGFGLHLISTILRGVAADRVPWSNMWEFSLTGTLIIVGIYLLVNIKYDLRFMGTFILGLVSLLLMIAAVRYYVPVVPLPPALQSYWLVIHVIIAIAATAFFAISFALSVVQLLRTRRDKQEAEGKPRQFAFLETMPSAATLENLAYRITIVAFILWTFTLIAGSIWADKAWGRYWGWDTKEVWTFIIWVVYAGYIHARATRGWRGTRSAWLSIIGFCAVMFNFGIVNVFFHGLHTYSGLG